MLFFFGLCVVVVVGQVSRFMSKDVISLLSQLIRTSNLFNILYLKIRPTVVLSDPGLPHADWTAVMIKYCCSDAFQILQK